MKPYLLVLAILLTGGIMMGFVLPVLFSAQSDGLVILGVAALLAYLVGTGLLLRLLINASKKASKSRKEITDGEWRF